MTSRHERASKQAQGKSDPQRPNGIKAWQTMPTKKLSHIMEHMDPPTQEADPGLLIIRSCRTHDNKAGPQMTRKKPSDKIGVGETADERGRRTNERWPSKRDEAGQIGPRQQRRLDEFNESDEGVKCDETRRDDAAMSPNGPKMRIHQRSVNKTGII